MYVVLQRCIHTSTKRNQKRGRQEREEKDACMTLRIGHGDETVTMR